ncbi:MAG: hypothetical protein OXE59_04090 [Bacteroidetes bacterium]|nr:hypothetical protein [Bacteroidota bacterium]
MDNLEFIDSGACNIKPDQILYDDVTQTHEHVSYNENDHHCQLPLNLFQIFHEITDKNYRSTYHGVKSGYAGRAGGIYPNELEVPIPTIKLAAISEKILSLVCDYFTHDHMHLLSSNRQLQTNSYITDSKHEEFFSEIKVASRHEEIFSVLVKAKCFEVVEELKYLNDLTNDDPDELPMDLGSLKNLAIFFVENGKYLPEPAIGISPYELLQAEWHSARSSAVMKFLSDGKIRYAGVIDDRDNPKTIQDSAPPHLALENIREYISS